MVRFAKVASMSLLSVLECNMEKDKKCEHKWILMKTETLFDERTRFSILVHKFYCEKCGKIIKIEEED